MVKSWSQGDLSVSSPAQAASVQVTNLEKIHCIGRSVIMSMIIMLTTGNDWGLSWRGTLFFCSAWGCCSGVPTLLNIIIFIHNRHLSHDDILCCSRMPLQPHLTISTKPRFQIQSFNNLSATQTHLHDVLLLVWQQGEEFTGSHLIPINDSSSSVKCQPI